MAKVNVTKAEKKSEPKKPELYFVQKVIKEDTYTVLAGSQTLPEDEFLGLYYDPKNPQRQFIEPPFNPKTLRHYVNHNNILGQCIDAFEVNVDGTGYDLVPAEDGKDKDPKEEARLKAFLDEPYPSESLTSLRRKWRRVYESTGWNALECLRNEDGDLIGLRGLGYSDPLRFVRLDEPILVEKKLMRDGKEVAIKLWDRERRYCQKLGNNYVYYRDYGSSRHCHRVTGAWETEQNPIDPQDRASELLMFKLNPDIDTPYGLPRWINQLPSVIGSRKAEELNLEFFDSGGLPPAIIFIEGGTMATDMADQLRMYLSGQMKNRNRAVVVETQSTSGSLESTGKVGVKVERFGAESTKDSMFKEYDKVTEEHVRVGFRLPPLFLGRSDDYNYASAQVSYMVAEAQVFGPEREEFDSIFNRTVMKELGAKTCKFKSRPITLKDMEMQLKGLELAATVAEPESYLKAVNQITGLDLEQAEQPDPATEAQESADRAWDEREHQTELQMRATEHEAKVKAKYTKQPVNKLAAMAREWLQAEEIIPSKFEHTESEKLAIRKSVDELHVTDRAVFDRIVSIHVANALETGEVGASIAA